MLKFLEIGVTLAEMTKISVILSIVFIAAFPFIIYGNSSYVSSSLIAKIDLKQHPQDFFEKTLPLDEPNSTYRSQYVTIEPTLDRLVIKYNRDLFLGYAGKILLEDNKNISNNLTHESMDSLPQNEVNSIGFIYFYIISLFTILLFALIFAFRLRENLYFYYVGYLFFQVLYGFLVLQKTAAPFWNFLQNAPKLSKDLFEPIQFIFIGFYVFFIIKLLRIKKYDLLLSRVLYYFGIAFFVYAISRLLFSYFIDNPETIEILFATVRVIVLPINFLLIIWIIYKVKHPLLPYFIIGQSFFFIAALWASYVGYTGINKVNGHLLNFKEVPNIIFQVGLLLEVYCFSLALSKNFSLLRKEKELIDSRLIAQLQKNEHLHKKVNLELDQKVNEKTDELIKLYSKLEKEKEQKIKDDFTQRLRETEMLALRYQMNPHFIFNSLNAIKHTIMTSQNEDAVNYLDDFSSLLRGILQNSHHKKITVEEELEILELYLSLEKNRMGKEFECDIQIVSREMLSQYYIPPLLLQPFVENAIWHGLHPSLKAEKNLRIIFDTTENLEIIIEDNGIGRKESAKKRKLHNSIGTQLVKDRLTLYNHLSDATILLKIVDLEKHGHPLGTRITLTYHQ